MTWKTSSSALALLRLRCRPPASAVDLGLLLACRPCWPHCIQPDLLRRLLSQAAPCVPQLAASAATITARSANRVRHRLGCFGCDDYCPKCEPVIRCAPTAGLEMRAFGTGPLCLPVRALQPLPTPRRIETLTRRRGVTLRTCPVGRRWPAPATSGTWPRTGPGHRGCTRVPRTADTPSGRQQLDTSSVGTGCQLWLFRYAGVLWSPVTISTSGLRAATRGIIASNSSVRFTFASKLPSSPGAVGVLEVHEEEVVVGPVLLQQIDLFVQRGRLANDLHAHQPGQSLVHRVDGDRRSAQPIDFLVGRQSSACRQSRAWSGSWPWAGRPAGRAPDRRNSIATSAVRLARRILGDRVEGRHTRDLRIGVSHGAFQAFASKHHDEPMFLDRLHEQLHAGNGDLAQRDGQAAHSRRKKCVRPADR